MIHMLLSCYPLQLQIAKHLQSSQWSVAGKTRAGLAVFYWHVSNWIVGRQYVNHHAVETLV
jgi:hypothetical protein